MERRYLNKNEIIFFQKELIDRYGGLHGLRDEALLESAVGRYQMGYYADAIEASALMESLAVNHPFVDGNKRIAAHAAFTFLIANGYEILLDSQQAFDFFYELFETNQISYERIEPWIRANVREIITEEKNSD